MGQKINPISLRLPSSSRATSNRKFDTSAYSDYYYTDVFMKDISIRMYLSAICKQMHLSLGRIFLHYGVKTSKIAVFFSDAPIAYTFRRKKKKLNFQSKTPHESTQPTVPCAFSFPQAKLSLLFSKVYRQQSTQEIRQSTTNTFFQKEMLQLYFTYSCLRYSFFMYYFFCATHERLKLQHTLHALRCFVVFHQTKFEKTVFGKHVSFLETDMQRVPAQKENEALKERHELQASALHMVYLQQSVSKSIKDRAIEKFSRVFSNSKACELSSTSTMPSVKHQTIPLQKLLLEQKHVSKSISASQERSFPLLHVLNNKFVENALQKHAVYPTTTSLQHMQSVIQTQLHTYTSFFAYKLQNTYQSANVLAEEIVYLLEQNHSFRQIKSQILQDRHRFGERSSLKDYSFLKGLRVTCCGRVGGKSKKAQRAKTDILRYGQTSLHVFSSKVDFACKHAKTSLGIVGVKVWLCFF